jgi:transcriptional regulator with XRE-family HTH domain
MTSDGRLRSEEVAVQFGQNLKRCRRRAAMSQEELGRLASLHRTEIGMLEQGTRLARVDTLMKLAGALSVSPVELLEGIDWAPGYSNEGSFSITERTLKPRRRRRRGTATKG